MMPISRQKRIIVYQKRNREARPASRLESRKQQSHPLVHALSLFPSSCPPPPSIHYTIIPSANIQDPSVDTRRMDLMPPRIGCLRKGECNLRAKRTRMCFILIIFRKKETAFLPPLCLTGYSIHNNVAGELQPCVAWRWSQVKYEKILGEKLRSSGFFLSLLTRQRFLKVCSYLF